MVETPIAIFIVVRGRIIFVGYPVRVVVYIVVVSLEELPFWIMIISASSSDRFSPSN